MEPAARGSCLLYQDLFDGHVNIFILGLECKSPLFNFVKDVHKPLNYDPPVLPGNNFLLGKHPRMGNAPLDVVTIEAFIKMNRSGEGLYHLSCRPAEPPAPRFFLFSWHQLVLTFFLFS